MTQSNIDEQIAKAQKAKEAYEQSLAKAKAAIAKAEAAKKKADAIKRDFIKIQNAYRAGGVKGGLAAIAASQMGGIKGKLIAQIQGRVLEALNKFVNQCPNKKELERIIKLRNNLLKQITAMENRLSKFQSLANTLNSVVTGLKVAIQLIKNIPTPTAIIPPQSGGLGIPVSVLTRHSDTLIKFNKQLDKFSDEQKAITSLVGSTVPMLQNLKLKLQSIDIAIQQCIEDSSAQDLLALVSTTQPLQNTGSEGTPTDAQGNPNLDYLYKGYKLEIIQDPNSPKIAPRRYAIAKDKTGIVVLYGPSSFSSDTQVLLDEIKFRIDNQLP